MKSKVLTRLVFAAVVLLGASTSSADDIEPIEFDVFRTNGSLAVWADLASCLSSRRVEQLGEGIDIAIEYRLELRRPRKILGSQLVAEENRLLRIGYRLITEDYQLSDYSAGDVEEKILPSLARLHQFLADSVVARLAELADLDDQHRYFVNLKLTCITLTSFNLASDDDSEASQESPVRYLFRQFLEVTNFGRESFETGTRPFSLDELEQSD